MFRIRRVFDDISPINQLTLTQAQDLLREQFADLEQKKIDRVPELLRHPLKYGFRTILYVAEDLQQQLLGMALLDHDAELSFAYLDYLASASRLAGRGVGGALYDRVRSEALSLGVSGVFYECLPDDPALCRDPDVLKQNRARLRFYERYGARPITGTAYETPVTAGGDNPPYLVFDDLGQGTKLRPDYLRNVVKAILQRKYPDICGPDYVRMVLASIKDDPVQLRAPRYSSVHDSAEENAAPNPSTLGRIAVVVSDQHEIHHVHERGYVESPARIKTIRKALASSDAFTELPPAHFPDEAIMAVHDPGYFRYFKRVSVQIDDRKPLYPYVFPLRNRSRPPLDLPVRAGYYCLDTFTPISRQAYIAARRGVDCALTAAREVLAGRRIAYALVRPPGHHAERGIFGGFCYFNNAAIAAQYLSPFGRVAMLDIDYHHGNGQQDIFYERADVLTLSIHGHPRFAYPYFTGFAEEVGEGAGTGYNQNYPLPEKINAQLYLHTLARALRRIRDFKPAYLLICLGLDTATGDPTGTWDLKATDFGDIGKAIGQLGLPTLVIQEGGYRRGAIGTCAKAFLLGLRDGAAPGTTAAETRSSARRTAPQISPTEGKRPATNTSLSPVHPSSPSGT